MRTVLGFSCIVALALPAVAPGLSEADTSWKHLASCLEESPLVLSALSPSEILILGNDLTVKYRVAPDAKLSRIKLRVTNKTGELGYLGTDLPVSAGKHRAVWPKGKWNQKPHSGALANPRNGPYTITLVAETPGGGSISRSNVLSTQLVLQCDLEHDRPSKDEISSGLYRPMLDPKSPERLKIGLVQKGGKLTETVYSLAPPAFSKIIEEDLDNDPSELEVKSVHVEQAMQSTFRDGVYQVVMTNLRTGAGTRGIAGMPEGVIETWTITLR